MKIKLHKFKSLKLIRREIRTIINKKIKLYLRVFEKSTGMVALFCGLNSAGTPSLKRQRQPTQTIFARNKQSKDHLPPINTKDKEGIGAGKKKKKQDEQCN